MAATEGCQQRLRKELENAGVVGEQATDGSVTYDDLVRIPYLNAVINEGYRIDPITGIALSRTVPSGGVRLNGFDLPEGVSRFFLVPTLAGIA